MKTHFTCTIFLVAALMSGCSKKDKVMPAKPDTTVVTPPVSKSDANDIQAFTLNNFSPAVTGSFKTKDSITFPLPVNPGINPGLPKPAITFSAKATISPLPDVAQDLQKTWIIRSLLKAERHMSIMQKPRPPVRAKNKPVPPHISACIMVSRYW